MAVGDGGYSGPGSEEGTGYGGSDSVDASSEGWGGAVADTIDATIAEAKVAQANYKSPPKTQSIDQRDTRDKESLSYSPPANPSARDRGFTLGDESTYAAYEDAKAYSDKGWAPGQALYTEDEDGKRTLVNLPAHTNAMPLSDLEVLRQKAYAAKASQQGWNVPFFGKVSNQQIAQQAMAMLGGPVTSLGMGALSAISVPYDARVSGTAAERAALGYYGPGYPTGLPNIGPHMKDVDRNWDDARWSDNYSSDAFTLGQTVDHQGNKMNAPTSPAGGEVITVAAPPGAPDQRVTQFKALYPEDWTETLTDEEIIEMVENPDQLRYWLSWRQT